MNAVQIAAVELATRGWYVFPAPPGEKKSYLSAEFSGGRNWGATNRPDEVRGIFERYPEANVGIMTGMDSGVFVVEADTPEGHAIDGIAALAALEATHGALPPTLQAQSPSGSIHYYFNHPGFPVKNSASKIAPGVDVRGDGGMVIAPPSVKPGVGSYTWRNALPVADAPAWLLVMVKGVERSASTQPAREAPVGQRPVEGSAAARALRSACEAVVVAEKGTRNHILNTSAFLIGRYVAAGEIARDVAFADLLNACDECGLLADEEEQCKKTINSGLGGGAKDPAKTTQDMFGTIAPVAPPPPANAQHMVGANTAAAIDIGLPMLARFNAANSTVLHDTDADNLLPLDLSAAELRAPLTEAIGKVLTLAKTRRSALQFDAVRPVFAVLRFAHEVTYHPLVATVRATGARLPEGMLQTAFTRFESEIQRLTRTAGGWITNTKHQPDSHVSENVDVLLALLNTELRYNNFAQTMEFSRNDEAWGSFGQRDLETLHYEANSAKHRFHATEKFLCSCATTIARRRCYNPLHDYLDPLEWDGVPRLDAWLHHACGVPVDAYHAAVGRNVIGGLVKRARLPGEKHDEIMLLIGGQGVTKSGLARSLMPNPDWFAESLQLKRSLGDLIPEISGKWCIEWAELTGKGAKEIEDIKAFITRTTDRFTAKYATIAGDHPRQMIFIATSNDETPLRDETGNRRFLPVHVQREIDIAWIVANRDQLFAEACDLFAKGERFGIPRDMWATAGEHQEAARERPLYEDYITEWFGNERGPFYVTSTDMVEALNRKGIRGKPKIGNACKRVGLVKAQSNRIHDYWVSNSHDLNTAPRLHLMDPRPGEDRSRVRWMVLRAPDCPPPMPGQMFVGPPPY